MLPGHPESQVSLSEDRAWLAEGAWHPRRETYGQKCCRSFHWLCDQKTAGPSCVNTVRCLRIAPRHGKVTLFISPPPRACAAMHAEHSKQTG